MPSSQYPSLSSCRHTNRPCLLYVTMSTTGSAATPAARCRNCRWGSFITLPPGEYEKPKRYGACSSTEVWKCAPADGTNAALENEEDSARPLAARITGYLAVHRCGRGANGRCWPEAAEIDVRSNVCHWGLSGLVILTLSFVDPDRYCRKKDLGGVGQQH